MCVTFHLPLLPQAFIHAGTLVMLLLFPDMVAIANQQLLFLFLSFSFIVLCAGIEKNLYSSGNIEECSA